jgi:hypothetical protein
MMTAAPGAAEPSPQLTTLGGRGGAPCLELILAADLLRAESAPGRLEPPGLPRRSMEMAKNLPKSESDPESFLAGLDAKERKIVKDLSELMKRLPKDLRWHHAVGRLVDRLQLSLWEKEVVRRPEKEDMRRTQTGPRFPHGEKIVEHLGGLLGVEGRLLYKCQKFASEHPKKDLKRMEGWGVTWSMFDAVMASHTPQVRLDLLEKAYEGGSNAAQVKLEVDAGKKERHAGGRPPRRPQEGAPEAGLQDLIDRNRNWARYLQDGWLATEPRNSGDHPLLPALPELARQSSSKELVRLLGKARAELLQTIIRTAQLLYKLPSQEGPGS